MDRSNLDAMLNYYRVLFPSEPYGGYPTAPPMITMPTLMIYGKNDPYLLADGLNGLWNYVSGDLTINTWADTGHFAQHEQPERLTQRLVEWLARPETKR
jgi:pimeloyl-ACP methyl ester carboxylesterase